MGVSLKVTGTSLKKNEGVVHSISNFYVLESGYNRYGVYLWDNLEDTITLCNNDPARNRMISILDTFLFFYEIGLSKTMCLCVCLSVHPRELADFEIQSENKPSCAEQCISIYLYSHS